jgi:hypothetical protein
MGQVMLFGKEDAEPERDRITFEDFWTLYPRRVAKKDAARAWARTGPLQRARILTALASWRMVWEARGELQFVPHPATWLNGERWEDELPPGNWKPREQAPSGTPAPEPKEAPAPRSEMPAAVREMIAKLRLRRG